MQCDAVFPTVHSTPRSEVVQERLGARVEAAAGAQAQLDELARLAALKVHAGMATHCFAQYAHGDQHSSGMGHRAADARPHFISIHRTGCMLCAAVPAVHS